MNEKENQDKKTAEERQFHIIDDLVDREFQSLQKTLQNAVKNFKSVHHLDVKQERRLQIGTIKSVEHIAYDPTGIKTNPKKTFDITKVPKSENALMSLYKQKK